MAIYEIRDKSVMHLEIISSPLVPIKTFKTFLPGIGFQGVAKIKLQSREIVIETNVPLTYVD